MNPALGKPSALATLALALLCLLATARPADAAFPGRPGLIVFNHITSIDDHHEYVGGLYAIKPGWSQPRQLTEGGWDDEASFAPSGRRLVFSRPAGPQPGIYTLNLDSGKTRRLTRGQADRSPAFGLRGRVVFSRPTQQSGSYDLFLRTPAGRLRRLTSTSADDVDPVFTPDGSKVVFTQDHLGDFPADEPRPPRKISSIRIDGGGLEDVEGLTEASRVDISPDGRNLIFQRPRMFPNGDVAFRVWTKRLDGGRPKLIAESALIPVYSPSGEGIAYSMFRELWLLGFEGNGDPRLLSGWDAVLRTSLEGKTTSEPAWQPLP
jgi:hypothetical protein